MDTTAEDTQKKLQDLLARVAAGHPLSYAETEFLKSRNTQPRYETQKDVADFFSISPGALRRWEEKYPEAFVKGPNGYDIEKIKAARQQFLASGKYTRLNDGDTINVEGVQDVASLKARKIFLECKNLEIKNKKAEAILIEVDKVLTAFRAICYAVKDKFCRLPSELAYEVSGVTPAEAEQRMREKIDKICQELSVDDYSKLEDALTTPTDDGDDLEVKPAEPEKQKPKRQKK
jgi:hypothetical protein